MTSDHAETIRSHSSPLAPIPTGEAPKLTPLPGVRSVVFDIYGTLVISAAGDISLADDTGRDDLLRQAIETGTGHPFPGDGAGLTDAYLRTVHSHQDKSREEGIEYPEVEIRDVWRELLAELLPNAPNDQAICERIAVAYECSANPVWPMPHLAETLTAIREKNLALGIVSNAQFYTLSLFPAFLDDQDLGNLGFDEQLQVYSYRLKEGKPSRRLYEILAEKLAAQNLAPNEVLYVGNDLRNDIWPAQAVGFRTALFAGDRRSLRWREDDPRVAEVTPNLVITDLSQLIEVLD
jgi:putative hydrolase of the HAD superfamily